MKKIIMYAIKNIIYNLLILVLLFKFNILYFRKRVVDFDSRLTTLYI